jgi:hypothetical protein
VHELRSYRIGTDAKRWQHGIKSGHHAGEGRDP